MKADEKQGNSKYAKKALISAAIFGAGMASGLFVHNSSLPQPQLSKTQNASASVPYQDTDVYNQDGIQLKLLASEKPGFWKGIRLAIDQRVQAEWEYYAPVIVHIPHFQYAARARVEEGASAITTTFDQPITLEEKITYTIIGFDPVTKEPTTLFNRYMVVNE